MKVALVAPLDSRAFAHRLAVDASRLPAGASCITQLALALHDAGIDLTLVTLTHDRQRAGEFVGDGLRLVAHPYRAAGRVRDLFADERRAIASTLQSAGVEVVHAHWTYEFALGALQGAVVPTLTTVHDWGPAVLSHNVSAYRLIRLLMQQWVLRQGIYFTAVSPYIADKIARFSVDPIPVIPNGIEEWVFSWQDRFRAGAQPPTLLSVNNGWGKLKNVSTLLHAFAELRREYPCMLKLVGPQYEIGGPAHAWAQEHGLEHGVTFVGPLSRADVLHEMQQADLYVHPSLEESFGNVLIEAAAKGTPTIGGRNSGAVPWVLGGEASGSLIDVLSHEKLAQKILAILQSPDEWKRMSFEGRAQAWARFRFDTVIHRYIDCYRRLQAGLPLRAG